MIKQKFSTMVLIVALGAIVGAVHGQNIALEVKVGKALYGAGDTAVIGIKASIPRDYHLYANPLGPGIGKPLNLYINKVSDDNLSPLSVRWLEAYKSAPARYTPSIGSWVWAYETEAYFFIKGALNHSDAGSGESDNSNNNNAALTYKATIEALICHTACVPTVQHISFDLPIETVAVSAKTTKDGSLAFPTAQSWQARYVKSEPMEFNIGAYNGSPLTGIGAEPSMGLIDLGGLSAASVASSEEEAKLDDDDNTPAWDFSPREEKRREYNLLTAIIFALLAGLALNLTPCIFPVLGIRILSFAESAKESRRAAVIRSVAFAGGIVLVFLLLAALAAFAGFSWGQQFQNPAIITGIIAMIFLFALSMFDFYTLGIPSAISGSERKIAPGLGGDFLKGAMATVMATPCGGPFLGALLAWALLQKPATIFIVFATMGVGMALPYVLLSSSRRLQKLLPKPGRWIEDLKHAMGFLLLAFAVNLLKSLDGRLIVTAVGICVSLLIAASVNKRYAPFGTSSPRRYVVILIAAALLTIGTVISVTYLKLDTYAYLSDATPVSDTATEWVDFSPTALILAQNGGRNVIVNFTASWCSNCKLNKSAVINAPAARQLYLYKNITLLTADITTYNPQAQNLLNRLGARSIPFIAIFPSNAPKSPIIMRDILHKERYLKTLRELP